MTCADTSVIARPLSKTMQRGAEGRRRRGKEERDEEEKEKGMQVKGGGSPQSDSRRQNVSRLERKNMSPCRESISDCEKRG